MAVIAFLLAGAGASSYNNYTLNFKSYTGELDANGDLSKPSPSDRTSGFKVVGYNFSSDSFSNPDEIFFQQTGSQISDDNVTIEFPVLDQEQHYGVFFYREGYLTYEYSVSLPAGNDPNANDWPPASGINSAYNFTLAKKTGAKAEMNLTQYDELAAGDAVDMGVNISVESPLEHTDYISYVPDSTGVTGEPNLTSQYSTNVTYDLKMYNITGANQNELLQGKTKESYRVIEFGETAELEYKDYVSSTGRFNVTGTSNPYESETKIKSKNSEIDEDYSQVDYKSTVETKTTDDNREFIDSTSFSTTIDLVHNMAGVDEDDIVTDIEYKWMKDPADGKDGLTGVSGTTNQSVSGSNPGADVSQNTQGDWYLCHRAWVDDTRGFVNVGKTTCKHFLIDGERPQINGLSPKGTVTYSETGIDFQADVSDNVKLSKVFFSLDGATKKTFNSFSKPAGKNSLTYNFEIDTGTYNYEWSALDKVAEEKSLSASRKSVTGLVVEALPTNPTLGILESGSSTSQVMWGSRIKLDGTTSTSEAPLKFRSNFSDPERGINSWQANPSQKGSTSETLKLEEPGYYNFSFISGEGDSNYKTQVDSKQIKVSRYSTSANIQIGSTDRSSYEFEHNATINLKSNAGNETAPIEFGSNFTGTGWSDPGTKTGSYSENPYLDEAGFFEFNATAGTTERFVETKDSLKVNVTRTETDANLTVRDQKGNKAPFGIMEKVTVNASTGTMGKPAKSPVAVDSNLTLSEWENVSKPDGTGRYTKTLRMKESGYFRVNMSAGGKDDDYVKSQDSVEFRVQSGNGDKDLSFNETLKDQKIFDTRKFNYEIEANYSGSSDDLIWKTFPSKKFEIEAGSDNITANVTNSTNLNQGEYKIDVETFDEEGSYVSGSFNLTVTPELYWNQEPSDDSIDEGKIYSRDISGNARYIGDMDDLTWNITDESSNPSLFTVEDGKVESTQTLSSGTYTVGVNTSESDQLTINTTFELKVNSVNTGSSGGGGGSSGGGGGGGGFSISTSSSEKTESAKSETDDSQQTEEEPETVSLESNRDGSFSGTIEVSANGTQTVNLELEGLKEVAELEENEFNVTGNGTVTLDIRPKDNATPGNYTATVKVSLDGERYKEVQVEFTVPERISTAELGVSTQRIYSTSEDVTYTIEIGSTSDSPGEAKMFTVLQGREEVRVFNSTVSLLNHTVTKSFGKLEAGEYTVSITLDRDGKRVTETATFEVRERRRTPTGGFFGGVSTFVSDLSETVREALEKVSPF
ncbi:MAG: hypothetical protein ABEJ03_05830 [Candidatus Nanohaloarchaea archaeon]